MAVIRDVMPAFELLQPTSIADAQSLLEQNGSDAWVLAGGLDSFDWLKDRIKRPRAMIDLSGVEELKGIRTTNGGIEVGTNEVVFGVDHAIAFARADDELGVERNQGGRRVGGVNRDTSVGVQDRMLAVATLRRVGITDVSARAIAGPAGAVVPASSILRDIAAEGALVPYLRRGYYGRAFRQQTVFFPNDRMLHDFRERGHRTDLDSAVGSTNSF